MAKGLYHATTQGITVSVQPQFLDDQSQPSEGRYVWAYHIVIENGGREQVQLLNRHWRITNASGRMEEVRGPGVVGEQPILKPGETFRYTSGSNLSTPSGIMTGAYRMVDENGEEFDAQIPVFSLDSPFARRVLN